MQENIKDKETCRFMYPTGIVSYVFLFSDRALQWLCGTTTDDGGRTAGNFALLGDLLARMALTTEEAKGFRRPLMLSAGQAQYSDDLSLYPAMDGCGRQYCFQPFYPYKQRGRIEQIQWQTGRIRAFCCSRIRQPSGTCLLFQWPMQGTCGMKRQR